jgi:hypothetical protein
MSGPIVAYREERSGREVARGLEQRIEKQPRLDDE